MLNKSLTRLQSAGKNNKIILADLKQSVMEIASFIADNSPADIELPRGYRVQKDLISWSLNKGILEISNRTGSELSNRDIFTFTEDISTGLLDEILEFVEKQNKYAKIKIIQLKEIQSNVQNRNKKTGVEKIKRIPGQSARSKSGNNGRHNNSNAV